MGGFCGAGRPEAGSGPATRFPLWRKVMSAFPLAITAIYAALLGLMLVPISVRITILRAKTKIMFFDGGDPELGRAIRVQGNFTEYVPLALILIALVEWAGVPVWALRALGGGLLVARLIHAWGLYTHQDLGRAVGATLSWIVIAVGALLVLYQSFAA